MPPLRKIVELANEEGYLLPQEYSRMSSLSEGELKRELWHKKWVTYTKPDTGKDAKGQQRGGKYTFRVLSNKEFGNLAVSWATKQPEEVKNSPIKDILRRKVNGTIRDGYLAGRISEEDYNKAVSIHRQSFRATTIAGLEDAVKQVDDLGLIKFRRVYTPDYAREFNISVNDDLYNSKTKEGKKYKKGIDKEIKKRQNTEYARLNRPGSLGAGVGYQIEQLAQSKEAYSRKMATNGYRHWLAKNPNAIIKKPTTWWELQPEHVKKQWYELGGDVQKHNNNVIEKYLRTSDKLMNVGQVPPTSVLLQWHHLMPRSFGGINTPENLIGAMGNAFGDVGKRHAILHDVKFDPTYKAAKLAGMKVLPFEPDDPKIFEKSGAVKKSGMMTFMDILGSIGKKALGPLGAAFALDAAQNYWTEGKPVRASLAAASALPVIGLPAAAGEGLINASEWVYNQPTVYPEEPYYGMGRQRGLLEGHAGIGEEEQKRRTNIWT